jgi:hypothetical protein
VTQRGAQLIAIGPACCLLWALGCNALSGVNDLQEIGRPDTDAARADAAVPRDADAASPDVRTHDFDALPPDDAALPPLLDAGPVDAAAGLCTGLTMLLRLDGTTTSAQGTAPVSATGVSFGAGKFGQGLVGGNTQVDYPAQAGALASSQQGTVSMWIDSQQWELPCQKPHPFFGVDDTGVYMDCEPVGYLGVYVDLTPTSGVSAVIPPASGTPVWSTGYNHLVATWSATDGLTITLNGAVGQTTRTPYTPPDAVATVFHLLASNAPALATVDDVAVWTRPLTIGEIQTIYSAGVSVGDVCKLK